MCFQFSVDYNMMVSQQSAVPMRVFQTCNSRLGHIIANEEVEHVFTSSRVRDEMCRQRGRQIDKQTDGLMIVSDLASSVNLQ